MSPSRLDVENLYRFYIRVNEQAFAPLKNVGIRDANGEEKADARVATSAAAAEPLRHSAGPVSSLTTPPSTVLSVALRRVTACS